MCVCVREAPCASSPSKANFYPLSEQNSVQLAATLLLELSQPVPVCRPILNHLHQVDPSPAPHHAPSDGGSFDELVAKQMVRDVCAAAILPFPLAREESC